MALVAGLTARVTATHTGTAPTNDLGTLTSASQVLDYSKQVNLTSGTGAGQVDRIFSDTRTITASSTEDLDLAGVLTDSFGATITFARVKAIMVTAASGNTNNVVVGAGTNPWLTMLNSTGTVTLRPGAGFMAWIGGSTDTTGWAVTAATGDILKVANSSSGSSVTYDIVILGCSA